MELDSYAKSFQNVTNPSSVIERTCNTVIQCLTLNYDLYLEPTLVNHELFVNPTRGSRYTVDTTVCLTLKYHLDLEVTLVKYALRTLSHGTLHLCQVILKFHQPFKCYKADM